jgi:hypothetical protein
MIKKGKDEELQRDLTDREGQYRWTGSSKSGEKSNKERESTERKKGKMFKKLQGPQKGGREQHT